MFVRLNMVKEFRSRDFTVPNVIAIDQTLA